MKISCFTLKQFLEERDKVRKNMKFLITILNKVKIKAQFRLVIYHNITTCYDHIHRYMSRQHHQTLKMIKQYVFLVKKTNFYQHEYLHHLGFI